ncbi:uncharacterized protein LOC108845520 [Raphanus sativus]|uniref:Uncharacterized protein LOC108845520 n=1 Tax=Raphanus sativus TaxID=3726 RepID=A0A9W3DF34_RAPSA|nr:uncharacterized protein LOC108845520 [Raphanus sativus]
MDWHGQDQWLWPGYGFLVSFSLSSILSRQPMVQCKKVKQQGRLGRKEKPKFGEICMRRNLGILRRVVPSCEEVDDEEALILKSIQHLMLLKSQVTLLRTLADVC